MANTTPAIPPQEPQASQPEPSDNSATPICPHCLKALDTLDHFCPHCCAPISGIAAIDPIGQALSTGFIVSQATAGSNKASFIIALLIFVPATLVSAGLAFSQAHNLFTRTQNDNNTAELFFRFIATLLFLFLFSYVLWSLIRNHRPKTRPA